MILGRKKYNCFEPNFVHKFMVLINLLFEFKLFLIIIRLVNKSNVLNFV